MNFTKYNGIDNLSRKQTVDYIVAQGFSDGEWVVENKIHGANFSIWYDGVDFKFAKRSGFIPDGENFYNHLSIADKLKGYAKGIFDQCDVENVTIYGEIFGGSYPDLKSTTKAVQKGVFYTPDIAFIGFDIKINGEFVDADTKYRLFTDLEIPFTPPLFRGKFRDVIEFDPVFPDPTYKMFGLDEVPDNFSEGVVLKPVVPAYFVTGSRVILKNKNPAFGEKAHAKKGGVKGAPQLPEVSDEAKGLLQELHSYVTENRIRNVLSKIGEVTNKDFGKVIKDLNEDVMEDFMKDNEDVFTALTKDEQKILTKSMNKASSFLLRENFLNIIDGQF
tara:strand:- start:162 stop:1157 length:996 start_codon:yes stop_codon:yes gene_type:complete